MGDLALIWDTEAGGADMAIVSDDVETDEGLWTSMYLSLFLDRRAHDDDDIPAGDDDRHGWWGNQYSEIRGDEVGSRLWLLDRSKMTPTLPLLVEQYVREALAWLIEDDVVERFDVPIETTQQTLTFAVLVYRPGRDRAEFRFPHVWEAMEVAA